MADLRRSCCSSPVPVASCTLAQLHRCRVKEGHTLLNFLRAAFIFEGAGSLAAISVFGPNAGCPVAGLFPSRQENKDIDHARLRL